MSDPARSTPDAPARPAGAPLTFVNGTVGADRRLRSVEEQRIALAGLQLLGAIEGLARTDDRLAELAMRVLAPTANLLDQELRGAGYHPGREPRS